MNLMKISLPYAALFLVLGSGNALAEGVYYSDLHLKVRSEAPHHEFRIPSNGKEAADQFCKNQGFKKSISSYVQKVGDRWQVQDLICSSETETSRSLKQAAKAYIAKQRLNKGLPIDPESKVLADNYLLNRDLFKKGSLIATKTGARKFSQSSHDFNSGRR